MKRFTAFLVTVLLMTFLCPMLAALPLEAPDFDAYSDSYVVIDAQTGQVLAEKNMNKREYPASITKIMTIALALERKKLDDTLTMSEQAVFSVPRSASHIALTPGEVITLRDAIMGALLPSANDAANGIAEFVGGSLEMFPVMMNAKATEVGALNTHFVNANGLEDDDHYTTAYDMAMITKYALTVNGFREVFGTTEYTMQPTNMQPEQRNFGTQHHMIVTSAYQYDGAWGGKLGWTAQANHTAVTVAKRGDTELICVVMNSKTKWEKYKDTAKLFDYCFDNLEKINIPAGTVKGKVIPIAEGKNEVGCATVSGLAQDYSLLVKKGTTAADIDVTMDAKVLYTKGEKIAPNAVFTVKGDGSSDGPLLTVPLPCEVETDERSTPAQMAVANETKVYDGGKVIDKPSVSGQNILFGVGLVLGSISALIMLFALLRMVVQRYYRKKRRRAYSPYIKKL